MDGVARTYTAIYDTVIALTIGTRQDNTYIPLDYRGSFLRGIGTVPLASGSTKYTGPTKIGDFQSDSYASHNHSATATQTAHSHAYGGGLVNSGTVNSVSNRCLKPGSNTYGEYLTTSTTPTILVTVANSGYDETRGCNHGVNWILKL